MPAAVRAESSWLKLCRSHAAKHKGRGNKTSEAASAESSGCSRAKSRGAPLPRRVSNPGKGWTKPWGSGWEGRDTWQSWVPSPLMEGQRQGSPWEKTQTQLVQKPSSSSMCCSMRVSQGAEQLGQGLGRGLWHPQGCGTSRDNSASPTLPEGLAHTARSLLETSALKPELNPLNLYFSGSDWSALLQAQLLCSYLPPTICFITTTTTTSIITTIIINKSRCLELRSWVCSPLTHPRAGKLRKPSPRKCIWPDFPYCPCNRSTFHILSWGWALLLSFTAKASWVPAHKPLGVTPMCPPGAAQGCGSLFIGTLSGDKAPGPGRTKKKPCTALNPAAF